MQVVQKITHETGAVSRKQEWFTRTAEPFFDKRAGENLDEKTAPMHGVKEASVAMINANATVSTNFIQIRFVSCQEKGKNTNTLYSLGERTSANGDHAVVVKAYHRDLDVK